MTITGLHEQISSCGAFNLAAKRASLMSIKSDPGPLDDPRADHPEATQEPPSTFFAGLRQVGPGLILAAAIVGTGELIATTNLGAQAGFALLWLVVVSCVIKVFVQVELGRYALSSGQATFGAFQGLAAPGKLLVWWCSIMLLVTQLQIGAMIGGIGQAASIVLPGISEAMARLVGLESRVAVPWGFFVTIVTAALLATGSYRLIERLMTVFVVGFTMVTVMSVALLPREVAIQGADLAEGMQFRIPGGAIAAALAMLGITGVGANELLAYPYWCIEKGYARSAGPRTESNEWLRRARGWLRVMQLDAWVSMFIYTIATLAFFLLGAAVLFDPTREGNQGLPDGVAELLQTLIRMYEPALGPELAQWFLVIGTFAVLYSTLFAATAGTGRLLADLVVVKGLSKGNPDRTRRQWNRVFCIGLPVLGFLLYITIEKPVTMVLIGGMMQAVTLPLIAIATVFLRYRRTDQRLRPRRIWDFFLWLSMVGLIAAGLYSGLKVINSSPSSNEEPPPSTNEPSEAYNGEVRSDDELSRIVSEPSTTTADPPNDSAGTAP